MSKLFSAAEAARETGVSRTTIMRKLAAGEFAQATKDDDGWRIPLDDLLAAGLNPGRPSPPVRGHDQSEVRTVSELSHQVELLRVQLAAAQQLAAEKDRLAAEKDRVIETQAHALRALEAPRTEHVPAPEPPQARPAQPLTRRSGLRGLLGF
ncbi:helix-turn-helix domain-containing protein [Gordonia sihwensis]|uniref:helix-turn-helix domain-containing protein n=1 Tax=Gordonia sihwensis TaxID=173559 RepID=UPI0012E08406|nr:helix-turn-helix domain-containing protein [Gordonia sihwensis]